MFSQGDWEGELSKYTETHKTVLSRSNRAVRSHRVATLWVHRREEDLGNVGREHERRF